MQRSYLRWIMGAADLNAWRRQNSDPVVVEVELTSGRFLKGTVLVPRDRGLREVFNAPEPFIEFECSVSGLVILAKSSVMSVRPFVLPKVDQLDKRLHSAEQLDSYKTLNIPKGADRRAIREAYVRQARLYHPDRYAMVELPLEVADFLNAMTRRINAAYSELLAMHGGPVEEADAA